jgi:hypothetical protein
MSLTLVQEVVVSTNTASVTIGSIPQDGHTLLLKVSARATGGYSDSGKVSLNNQTSGYAAVRLQGQNGGMSLSDFVNQGAMSLSVMPGSSTDSGFYGIDETYIFNYSNVRPGDKSVICRSVAEGQVVMTSTFSAGIAPISAAITSVTFTPSNYQIAAGSIIELYKLYES